MLRELYGIQPNEIEQINGRPPAERHSTLLGFREGAARDVGSQGALETSADLSPHDSACAGASVLRAGRAAARATVREIDAIRPSAALAELLAEGVVHAAFGDGKVVLIGPGRHVRKLLRPAQARRLMPDFARTTGASPVNHVVVIKESVLAGRSDLARILCDALERAKQVAYERAALVAGAYLLFPEAACADQARILGHDPFPSGIAANRRTLELLVAQLVAEGQPARPATHRGALRLLTPGHVRASFSSAPLPFASWPCPFAVVVDKATPRRYTCPK
jgi:hypothetical protein